MLAVHCCMNLKPTGRRHVCVWCSLRQGEEVPADDPTLSSTMVIRLIKTKQDSLMMSCHCCFRGCRGGSCGIVLGGCIEGVSSTGSKGERSWELFDGRHECPAYLYILSLVTLFLDRE